jgi:hypothetical protein
MAPFQIGELKGAPRPELCEKPRSPQPKYDLHWRRPGNTPPAVHTHAEMTGPKPLLLARGLLA